MILIRTLARIIAKFGNRANIFFPVVLTRDLGDRDSILSCSVTNTEHVS